MSTGRAIVRAEDALAWDLRAAWAAGWEIGVLLRCGRRVRCRVQRVAPTGAFSIVRDGGGPLHVPLEWVVSVTRPHFHESGWGEPVAPLAEVLAPPVFAPLPGQLVLDVGWTGSRLTNGKEAWVGVEEALREAGYQLGDLTDEQRRRAENPRPGLAGRALVTYVVEGKGIVAQLREARAARAAG